METKRIVVGIDFSEESDTAAREALTIARHTGAEIVLVHVGAVLRGFEWARPASTRAWQQMLSEHAAENVRRLNELRERLSVDCPRVSQLVIKDLPAEGLCRAVRQMDADLVVVGTHGRTGVKRFLLGSVAERIVGLCERNVIVARGRTAPAYNRLLVPTDFSPHSEAALQKALALASVNATVDLVHFWLPPATASLHGESIVLPSGQEDYALANERGEALVDKYQTDRVSLVFEAIRSPAVHGIVARATDYNAIVMGSHGRRGFRRFLLGSVGELTVRHAPCSVMVVHDPLTEERQ